MRLSRTGWNNVIIFSVMIIIIFLNVTNDKLFHRNSQGAFVQNLPLFKDNAVILTLTINEKIFIERQGKQWKIYPKTLAVNEQRLTQMMHSWHNATGSSVHLDYELKNIKPVFIHAELAGDEQVYQLKLYPTKEQLFIFNVTSDRWFSLPLAMYYQLLLPELVK